MYDCREGGECALEARSILVIITGGALCSDSTLRYWTVGLVGGGLAVCRSARRFDAETVGIHVHR